MSELRERMRNAMCLRGMAARTQESYIDAVAFEYIEVFDNRNPLRRRYWKAVVAIATKNAHRAWAVLKFGEDFRLRQAEA